MTPETDRHVAFWVHVVMLDVTACLFFGGPWIGTPGWDWPWWGWVFHFVLFFPVAVAAVQNVRFFWWRLQQEDDEDSGSE